MQQKRQAIWWIFFGLLMILLSIALEKQAFHLPFGIHETADDASYLRPAENWIDHGTWKDNSQGPSAYVQRPPLVGAIYAIGYAINPYWSKTIFMALAILLHLIAIRCLHHLLLATARIWRITGLILFTSLPCFYGFLSYSISEALVVSFIVIGITLFYQNRSGFILGSFLLLIYLFRPVLLLLFLPWFVIRLRERLHLVGKSWKIAFFIMLFTVLGWEGRKAYYTGHLLDLHPIYHEANWSTYRPPHERLSDLFRVWETKSELFHELCGKALDGKLTPHDVKIYCQERRAPIETQTLYTLLVDWSEITNDAIKAKATKLTNQEKELVKRIKRERKILVAEYPWKYYVYTPLRGFKEQVPKSHLNMGIFQETYRGKWIMEFIRVLSLILVVLSLVMLPASIIYKHPLRHQAIGIMLYLIYLFWIQRMNEDRYLLPAFVAAFCVLLFWANSIFKIQQKSQKKGHPIR